MRALIQRVGRASVAVSGSPTRSIGRGLVIYLGVGPQDVEQSAQVLADKIVNLRIFPNAQGRFDRSILDEKGEILLISQFTLYADCRKGRRPDFSGAASPALAEPLYDRFAELLRARGLAVKTGRFGAHMDVESLNDGPINIWIDGAGI
ncbi:MAG: D-aminoacyl-tRNA deacylase [Elusimicrobiota bacterium]